MDTDSFDLAQNYFEVFGLSVHGQPDSSGLREKYMALQRRYHPDKFVSADDAQRRKAVQIASFVNQAHQTLSDPLKCAEYCLHLQGVEADTETDAKMDPLFLMEQMEWRETLEDIDNDDPKVFETLAGLRTEIAEKISDLAGQTASHLESKNTVLARDSIRKWQFLAKLHAEADSLEARLDDLSG